MTETKLKLEYSVSEQTEKIPVIIVAAGNSTRMNGINKQFIEILGTPVIIRTLLNFQNSEYVSDIILVTREDSIVTLQKLAEKYGITKLSDIVCGGNSRQESVLNGLERLPSDEAKVLIHDGARPLVDDRIITEVVAGLEKYSAVTCAVKVKDTVKQITENGLVLRTVPRENLVAVQTPQGLNLKDYKSAVAKIGDVSPFTDDTSIMEAAGYEVLTVNGSYTNIKITTPEDIALAEAYLKEEKL